MRKSGHFVSIALCVVMSVGFSLTIVDYSHCADRALYVGEYCWSTGSGGFLRLGITLMGDGHFTFAGTIENQGDEWAINGNLEVINNKAVITFTNAAVFDAGSLMISSVGQAILDISTLNGTSEDMEMIWDGGVCSLEHSTDTLISANCDKNLPPDGIDRREELKRILKQFAATAK